MVLKYDAVAPLLKAGNRAVEFFLRRDLLGEDAGNKEELWELPEVKKILKKQQPDGGFTKEPERQKQLLEVWRNMRFLVQMYGIDKTHPALKSAAELMLSFQTDEGDIRGMIANQYAPYYTGAMLYLLISAGYAHDLRVTKAIEWLLSVRQDDGGWFIGNPGMIKLGYKEQSALTAVWTQEPERDFDFSLPFSAAGTGMAIRAIAAHPDYRHGDAAIKAARLLKSKLLKKDNWQYLGTPDHWVRMGFPYWWNDVVSALDMLCFIGIPREDEDVKAALGWLIEHQQPDGLWKVSYSKIHKESGSSKEEELRLWISLNILRVLKRYYPELQL